MKKVERTSDTVKRPVERRQIAIHPFLMFAYIYEMCQDNQSSFFIDKNSLDRQLVARLYKISAIVE